MSNEMWFAVLLVAFVLGYVSGWTTCRDEVLPPPSQPDSAGYKRDA